MIKYASMPPVGQQQSPTMSISGDVRLDLPSVQTSSIISNAYILPNNIVYISLDCKGCFEWSINAKTLIVYMQSPGLLSSWASIYLDMSSESHAWNLYIGSVKCIYSQNIIFSELASMSTMLFIVQLTHTACVLLR